MRIAINPITSSPAKEFHKALDVTWGYNTALSQPTNQLNLLTEVGSWS